MIDLHCHILPAIDDGARSWDMAEEMCSMAAEDGITHVVATPHANSAFHYDRGSHSRLLGELSSRTKGALKFSLGCDFNISYENLARLFSDPGNFTIGDTKYLLIELNDFSIPPNYQDLLFRMRSQAGITPILTHPERHPILQSHPEQVKRWIEAGCLVQVTANSFTGSWGRKAESAAMWLLRHGAIHVIASDAHDNLHRPPLLSKARKVAADAVGDAAVKRLVEDNPLAVVEGRAISALNAES